MAGQAVNLNGLFSQGNPYASLLKSTDPTQGLLAGMRGGSNVDMSDPNSLRQAAQEAYRRGDTTRAAQLIQAANSIETNNRQKQTHTANLAKTYADREEERVLKTQTDAVRHKLVLNGADPNEVDGLDLKGLSQYAVKMREGKETDTNLAKITQAAINIGVPEENLAGLDAPQVAAAIREHQKPGKPTALEEKAALIEKYSGTPEGEKYLDKLIPERVRTRAAVEKAEAEKKAATEEKLKEKNSAYAKAKSAHSVVTTMINHKGREASTGADSFWWTNPGSDSADFRAYHKQLEGKLFLEAYQDLKGGGTITEVEGAKAEAALGRLQLNQSDTAYKEALLELQEIFAVAMRRAEGKEEASTDKPSNGFTITEVS